MSSPRNRFRIEGNLGKDAELKHTEHGDVVNFSVAVNERWTDKNKGKHERTDWFDVAVWGLATRFAAGLKKGTPVLVEGKVRIGEYAVDGVKHKSWTVLAETIRKIDYGTSTSNPDAEDAEELGATPPF